MKLNDFISEGPGARASIGLGKLNPKINNTPIVRQPASTADKTMKPTKTTMVGQQAKLWDPQRAREAERMEKQGYAPEEIWAATGTVRGLEGRWRQEITDHNATISGKRPMRPTKLNKFLKHDEIFKSYPFLKNVEIEFYDNTDNLSDQGWTGGNRMGIATHNPLGELNSDDEILDTLIHEIQHQIQDKEGWGLGGNLDMTGGDWDDYARISGEIGARDYGELRRTLTPPERARIFPSVGHDFPDYTIRKSGSSRPGNPKANPHYMNDPYDYDAPEDMIPDKRWDSPNPWDKRATSLRPRLRPDTIPQPINKKTTSPNVVTPDTTNVTGTDASKKNKNVHKQSPMGETLSRIKGMFDDVRNKRTAIKEDGKIVPGVNTTVDVKPGETERQAKKFFGGNGKPKPLGVPGATPNQAFNLGIVNETVQLDEFNIKTNKNFQKAADYQHYEIYVNRTRDSRGKFTAYVMRGDKIIQNLSGQDDNSRAAAVEMAKEKINAVEQKAEKISSNASINLNVNFIRDELEAATKIDIGDSFYAKLEAGPKLVIANEDWGDDARELGFQKVSYKSIRGSEGTFTGGVFSMPASIINKLDLVRHGRYVLGNASRDDDGNYTFSMSFHSVAAASNDPLKLGTPALGVNPRR